MSFFERIFGRVMGVPGAYLDRVAPVGMGYSPEGEQRPASPVPGRYLDAALGVPGLAPPALGLRAFEQGETVMLPGNRAPTGWAPVDRRIAYVTKIDEGARGTWQTMQAIANMAVEASQDPGFVARAREIVRGCGSKDYECEYATILRWVKENITYRRDPTFMEMQQSPAYLMFVSKAGDCNNMTGLIAALDLSVGADGLKLRSIAADADRPADYSHIYPVVKAGGRWLAQDAVLSGAELGKEVPQSAWLMDPLDYAIVGT